MKEIVYYKYNKGKPYESLVGNNIYCTEDTEFLTLPKGRGKTVTVRYTTGKEVKYEMLKRVGHKRSQTFYTYDYATLISVHKESAKGYEYLFLFKDCCYVGSKCVPAVVARFMSFDEWCTFNIETGL